MFLKLDHCVIELYKGWGGKQLYDRIQFSQRIQLILIKMFSWLGLQKGKSGGWVLFSSNIAFAICDGSQVHMIYGMDRLFKMIYNLYLIAMDKDFIYSCVWILWVGSIYQNPRLVEAIHDWELKPAASLCYILYQHQCTGSGGDRMCFRLR